MKKISILASSIALLVASNLNADQLVVSDLNQNQHISSVHTNEIVEYNSDSMTDFFEQPEISNESNSKEYSFYYKLKYKFLSFLGYFSKTKDNSYGMGLKVSKENENGATQGASIEFKCDANGCISYKFDLSDI